MEQEYWHKNKDNLQISKEEWDEAMQNFKRPDWCDDESALTMGKACLPLMMKRNKISELFCEGCNRKKGVIYEVNI